MVIASAEKAAFFLETRMIQGEWNCLIFKKTENREGVIGGIKGLNKVVYLSVNGEAQ